MVQLKDVTIEYLFFHYVEKEGDMAALPKGGTHKLNDADLQKTYGKYFVDVTNKRPSKKSYYIKKDDSPASDLIKSKLEKLRQLNIPGQSEEFCEIATSFASKLTKLVTIANPGVLFTGRFSARGIRYIGMFKLSWVDAPYAVFDEIKAEFVLKKLAKALPSTGRFQKGAIYPDPDRKRKAYMKVYQQDVAKPAEYFNKFLGGYPPITGLSIMREIRRLGLSLNSGRLSTMQSLGLYDALVAHLDQQQRVVGTKEATEIIGQALPSVNRPVIKSKVEKELEIQGLVKASEVANLKAKFEIGSITVSGPMHSLSEHFKENGAGQKRHVIEGEVMSFKME